MNDKYAASRALNDLATKRATGEFTDTGVFPKLPDPLEDSASNLPGLLRPQAE